MFIVTTLSLISAIKLQYFVDLHQNHRRQVSLLSAELSIWNVALFHPSIQIAFICSHACRSRRPIVVIYLICINVY